jgi:hypothetical protein
VPDALASDYYREPETVTSAKRGPRLRGLRGNALRSELRALPFTLDQVNAARQAGQHRTPEQSLILDVFRVWVGER